MKKSRIFSVLMASALVASVSATAALSVSAVEITKSADIPEHTVGVVGDFNGWDNDVALTDPDGDGVYEGVVEIAEVTADMFTGWKVDDVLTGDDYMQFKVRLDGEWTDSWGNYEPKHDRTWNSQSNVPVKEAKVGEPIKFTVYFDIKNPAPAALENPDSYAEAGDDDFTYLNVYYKIEETVEPSVEEPSEEESSTVVDEPSTTTTESSTTTTTSSVAPATESKADTTTVPTGDATSAAALAAIVAASLGVAVVMTKKASSK